MKIVDSINKINFIFIFLCLFFYGCSTEYYFDNSFFNANEKKNEIKKNVFKKNNIDLLLNINMPFLNQNSSKSIQYSSIIFLNNKKVKFTRDYKKINKGSYEKKFYKVKHGDTLFYISYITGTDFYDLAYKNNILAPYRINVGQIINVDCSQKNNNKSVEKLIKLNKKDIESNSSNLFIDTKNNNIINDNTINNKKSLLQVQTEKTNKIIKENSNDIANSSNLFIKWQWPTDGKIIEKFSNTSGGNRGIDISGIRGQPVLASASGKIVYAGNGLRGYGELIIIKHNSEYLSAYAHNEKLLISDQQDVIKGQKIAMMGSTDTNSVRLHFEIRYKGKPVNPLNYLPNK
ncbi:murein hydrolase activator NlpD [Candidatus Providencia siddallii]|uniref:Murein hydrolase activator NlpD n=1 Tax=Candidatus Providencia siddallii TaxID=1715285 RepID=A0ABM9NNB0_9GAMM